MLKPAILYKDQVNELLTKTWYDPEYMYFWQENYCMLDFTDNDYWKRQFVCVDEDDNILGYFSYGMNRSVNRAFNFGFISFQKPNYRFAREVINHLKEQMEIGVIESMEFCCYADNPAVRGYEKLVKRFGGRKVGTLYQCQRLLDGKVHDSNLYEIVVGEK